MPNQIRQVVLGISIRVPVIFVVLRHLLGHLWGDVRMVQLELLQKTRGYEADCAHRDVNELYAAGAFGQLCVCLLALTELH